LPHNWVPNVVLSEQSRKDWQEIISTLLTAPFVHFYDQDSFELGAPQHVASLMTFLAMESCKVQLEASVPGVHVAEMLLSLGIERLVLNKELHKTERSGALFFNKLGAKLVAVITDQHIRQTIHHLAAAGCQSVLYRGMNPVTLTELAHHFKSVQWDLRQYDGTDARNLVQQINVPIQGLIVSYNEYRWLISDKIAGKSEVYERS
jgi:hypothetical protein